MISNDVLWPQEYIIRQLHRVYLSFVESLEPPLARLALKQNVFANLQPNEGGELLAGSRENIPVDLLLPFLLGRLFRLSWDELFAIAASGMFGLISVSLYDAMFDQQVPVDRDRLLLQNLLYSKTLSYWCDLFDQDSPFWLYHRLYFGEYYQAILTEKEKHWNLISSYNKAELYELARGKSAPRKILLAALVVRDGRDLRQEFAALATSIDNCAVADQILDDISDWEEDLKARRFSYLLTRVIGSHKQGNRITVNSLPDSTEFIVRLYVSGELPILLEQARELFEHAVDCVDGLECPEWTQFLEDRIGICLEINSNIETVVTAAKLLGNAN